MGYRIFLGPALIILGIGVIIFIYPRIAQKSCESNGGKWVGSLNYCITRACYNDGTCGHWAHPGARCQRLKLKDPISEVYFQLGQPDRVESGRYQWNNGKGTSDLIIATFSQEKLASLECQ